MEDKKCLIIIDANSVIHRAFHALPPLTTQKGEVVGAVYGFLLVLIKALKEFQPDFVAAAFDVKAPTFRHEKYAGYKAKRPKAPDELYAQIPIVKEVLAAFGIKVFEQAGFEADDIIGTIAHLAPQEQIIPKLETIILSGDSDALQLINEQTKVYTLRKGVKDTILYDEKMVGEKYEGLKPHQLIDYKALRGDPTDNIAGVRGIGEKTAMELIKEFGTLENIYEDLALVRPKIRDILMQQKDQAFLSKELVEINKAIPLDFNLQECRWENYDKTKASQILNSLNFYSLIPRLP